jgi:hypothetical protein
LQPATIIYANDALCRLSEYSWTQLIGVPISTVVVMQESHRQRLKPYLIGQY